MNNLKTVIVAGLTAFVLSGIVFILAPTQPAGSVASPDIMSPYFSFGGTRVWSAHNETLKTSTTTVCALQSPAATSTLISASINFKYSSTTASTVTIAKGATAYATTTSFGDYDIAAGKSATAIASTTSTVAIVDPMQVFAPSQWVVFGMAGGVGNFSPTGSCQAVWIQNAY